ncbi:MAG: UPF0147 family protein [Candidatus Aenigmarchaeota archaeon]|nr:UPF0147 family protein [Candidatus Aenigmarchaeota archaeon]MCK5321868.1 UPF0147 family protein [Candidatus Aenigmarchaeota archaeon]
MAELDEIMAHMDELKNDRRVPKNVRNSISLAQRELMDDNENINVKLNAAISILDEVSNDTNIQPFTRTQIWNLVSLLEGFQEQSD